MKTIDIASWSRKSQWDWFSTFADSTFQMDVRMDVTNTLEYAKKNNLSSFALVLYLICTTLNRLPAFRLRILEGKVVEIDSAKAGYTIKSGDRGFSTASARVDSGFQEYLREIEENKGLYSREQIDRKYNEGSSVGEFFCTCVPWVDFLSVKHPIPDKDKESQSVPRVCWGKYTENNGRYYMTLNIAASHALLDGRDMAEAFIEIQKSFDAPENHL